MSEEYNLEETSEVLDSESSVIKELRQQIKDLKSENANYKPFVQDRVFKEAGVDVNTPFGKAVSKLYSGPLEAGALRDFVAAEFGEAPVPQNTEQQEVVQAQRNVSQVMSRAGSKQPVDAMDAFNEVISTGSTRDAIKAKMFMIEQNKQNRNR